MNSDIMALQTRLETLHEEHRAAHQTLDSRLGTIQQDIAGLQQYLRGNGRITVVVEKQRLRFAGSLSLKALGVFGTTSTGGIVYIVGKAAGLW